MSREAGPLIDVARGGEHAVGPQRDPAIARLARQSAGLPRPAARRCRVRARSARPEGDAAAATSSVSRTSKDRADILAISLGDPAALALGGPDCERRPRRSPPSALEPLVPAVFLTVKRAMPADDPAHVAGTRRPQDVWDWRRSEFRPARCSMVPMAATRRSWSAAESLPSMAATSSCERWSSGAKAIRPLTVSDNRL